MKQKNSLLIVDEEQNTTTIEDIFKCKPYEVHKAYSGEFALEKMHSENIEILITNFDLPDFNGLELYQHCKNINSELNCIIIADSKKYADLPKDKNLKILKKPFHDKEIILLVENIVNRIKLSQYFTKPVLLVEDTQFMLLTETKMLNEIGFTNIIKASDGSEAIKKIKTIPDDIGLIISDWNMPDINGYELLEWVKKNKKYKDIPFIMATSQAEKKQVDKAVKAGANEFLIKPFGAEELQTAIESVFGIKKQKTIEKELTRLTNTRKKRLYVGHIPITDHLILGVLKHLISIGEFNPKYFELETRRMLLWNPMQSALEKGDVDAAFILAPIVMDIFNYGIAVKIVLLAHKNGSICVKNKGLGDSKNKKESLKNFFRKKIFYLPHILSVHHIISHMYLSDLGLNLGYTGQEGVNVFYEVIPPIMMPDFQAEEKNVAGFMVAEPVGAKAIDTDLGEKLFLSSDIWKNHPCCVLAMRNEFIEKHEDAAHEFVNMLIAAGKYITDSPKETVKIATAFLDPDKSLGFNSTILQNVLMDPNGIRTDDLIPVIDDFDKIQRYMYNKLKLGSITDLEKLIDTRFID